MILILVWSYKQSIESKRIQYFEIIFAQSITSKNITLQMLSQKIENTQYKDMII